MNELVSATFERGFMSRPLDEQIQDCDNDELVPRLLNWFRNNQPVLEAGCGSGRWCAWFAQQGISSDGIDWSPEMCARASREIPKSKFFAGDLRQMPFPNNAYGGIIALGSIEHTADGPETTLSEFNRILRPGGIALITVPYGARLRLLVRFLNKPLLMLRACKSIRIIFGKPIGGQTLRIAKRITTKKWHPRFVYGAQGWAFYEYEFNRIQMRNFLERAHFTIIDESVIYANAGLMHTFGPSAGKWNGKRQDCDLSILGKILRLLFSKSATGHMLCFIVRKPI